MVATAPVLSSRSWPREAAAVSRGSTPGPGRGRRTGGLLLDAGILLGLVYLLPFVILAAGAPLALALKSLLWLVGSR